MAIPRPFRGADHATTIRMNTLRIGDVFPTIESPALGGTRVTVPAKDGAASILLFYRGHW